MLHKFLNVLIIACLATTVVLLSDLWGSQRGPQAGGLPSDAKSVASDDSAKSITEADSTGVPDSVKVVKEGRRRFRPPPEDYPVTRYHDGIDYVSGRVVLENDRDTILLKEFGFRDFKFWWRDSTIVKYRARWPKELPWDSLPPQLKGLGYWTEEVIDDRPDPMTIIKSKPTSSEQIQKNKQENK